MAVNIWGVVHSIVNENFVGLSDPRKRSFIVAFNREMSKLCGGRQHWASLLTSEKEFSGRLIERSLVHFGSPIAGALVFYSEGYEPLVDFDDELENQKLAYLMSLGAIFGKRVIFAELREIDGNSRLNERVKRYNALVNSHARSCDRFIYVPVVESVNGGWVVADSGQLGKNLALCVVEAHAQGRQWLENMALTEVFAESGPVSREDVLLPLHQLIGPAHVRQPDDGPQVGELEVEGKCHVVVDARASPAAYLTNTGDQLVIVGHDRAALPCGNDLRRAERK
jgi:hypothetical protein